jgi:formylglycine-generating enzyme required for sulfatase activity
MATLHASVALAVAACLLVAVSSPAHGQSPQPGTSRMDVQYLLIPPGSFRMGCAVNSQDCPANELPIHDVRITTAFYLGRTEITTGAYKRFAGATGRVLPRDSSDGFDPTRIGRTTVCP